MRRIDEEYKAEDECRCGNGFLMGGGRYKDR